MLLRLLLSVRNTTYNSGGSLRIIGARVMLPHKRAPRPFDRISVVSEISCCAIGSNVLMLNVLPEWHFEDVWHRCPRSAILRHRHSSCGILIRMPQLHRLKFCCRGDGVHRRLRSRRPRLRLDGPRRARPVRPRRSSGPRSGPPADSLARPTAARRWAKRVAPPRWPRRPVLKGLNVCDDRRDGRPDNQNPNRNRDGRGDQRHRVQFHFHDSPPQYGSWPYSGQYNPTAAITSAAIAAA
jgi:hypothetical protein